MYVPRAGLSYCGFIWPPPLFKILAQYRRFFTKSSLRVKPPEQTGAIQSVRECTCVHLWPWDVYLCTARVVVLVPVGKCSQSREDSYRQCSSLTALATREEKLTLEGKVSVLLKQTHSRNHKEFRQSGSLSDTHITHSPAWAWMCHSSQLLAWTFCTFFKSFIKEWFSLFRSHKQQMFMIYWCGKNLLWLHLQ